MPGFESTENEIRYRVADPDLFEKSDFRRKVIADGGGPKEISLVIGKRKATGKWETQAVRFAKKTDDNPDGWTEDDCKKWVEDHPRMRDDGRFRFMATVPAPVVQVSGAFGEIELLPVGHFTHREYGEFDVGEADLDAAIHNFMHAMGRNRAHAIPVDYEHASSDARREGDGKAAGWIEKLTIKTVDGIRRLFGFVRWTPAAANYIKNDEYRYISPEFARSATSKTDGKPIGLKVVAAALTNRPFFEGQQPVYAFKDFAESAEYIGLVDCCATQTNVPKHTADNPAENKEIQDMEEKKLRDMEETVKAKDAEIVKLTETIKAKDAEIVKLTETAKAKETETKALTERLGAVEHAMKLRDVTAAVDLACREGRVPPAEKEFWIKYATEHGTAAFTSYVQMRPPAKETTTDAGTSGAGVDPINDPDKQFCALAEQIVKEKQVDYGAAQRVAAVQNPALAKAARFII